MMKMSKDSLSITIDGAGSVSVELSAPDGDLSAIESDLRDCTSAGDVTESVQYFIARYPIYVYNSDRSFATDRDILEHVLATGADEDDLDEPEKVMESLVWHAAFAYFGK